MKSKLVFSLLITTIYIGSYNFTFGQELNPQKAFFYYVKLYYENFNYPWAYYAMSFDEFNYNNSKNDEFEQKRYGDEITAILKDGVLNTHFIDKFTLNESATFGDYNFDAGYFPIKEWSYSQDWWFGSEGTNGISISLSFFNIKDFNAIIRMNSTDANNLIKSKKSANGEVNRKVTAQFTYSIANRKCNQSNKYSLTAYIHSISFYNDGKLLSTIYPEVDYYDKINGIKFKDTVEIIYYKTATQGYWRSSGAWHTKTGKLPTKEGAKYFREIKFVNGLINDVKDYFISGQLEMTGNYSSYFAELEGANGLFTWYYENGIKRQEVNFINGNMEGCLYQWKNDGKCMDGPYSSKMYHSEINSYTKDCPCSDQTLNQQMNNSQIENNKVVPSDTIKDNYIGNFDSVGNKTGFGKMLYANGNVYEGEWKNNLKNGQGKQSYKDGSSYEGEWKDNKIEGYGTIIWANGKKYVGYLVNNQMHGKGIIYESNGNKKYEGDLLYGAYNGFGINTFTDSEGTYKYEGEWIDGKWYGNGTYTENKAGVIATCVCEFKNGGIYNGRLITLYPDQPGVQWVTEYKDGKKGKDKKEILGEGN